MTRHRELHSLAWVSLRVLLFQTSWFEKLRVAGADASYAVKEQASEVIVRVKHPLS